MEHYHALNINGFVFVSLLNNKKEPTYATYTQLKAHTFMTIQ